VTPRARQPRSRRLNLFAHPISGYLSIGAGVTLAAGLWLLWSRTALWFGGQRATGHVVELRERLRGDRSEAPTFMPIVRFTDSAGISQQFQSRTGGAEKRWPVGAPVPVLFDPLNPSRAEIAAPLHFWTAPAGVLLFGVLLLLSAWKTSS
jgi:hypothetical protein